MNVLEKPRISIVIPVYNRAHIISRALQSIFKQTLQEFEIILVNDGSTDELEKALEPYTDPRLRVLNHSQNKGASAARNTGIRAAHGSLIAFLDSDDEWGAEKLETQITHFDASREKNKNVMASFTWFFLNKNKNNEEIRTIKKVKNWRNYFLDGCFISPGSTLLVDKRVYDDIGFYDESLKRFEDWDWLLRFSKKFDLVACEFPLSRVYVGERPSYQNIHSSLQQIVQKHQPTLSFYEKRKLYSTCQMEYGYVHLRENFSKFCGYFFLAIIANPFALKKALGFLTNQLTSKIK